MPNFFQQANRFAPLDPLQPTYVTAEIDAFTGVNSIPTTPTIVFEYPLTNTINVSLGLPILDELPDTTYLVAVRFQNSEDETVRYILYNNENSGFTILYPTYNGQVIAAEAIIEIWANPAESVITASQDLTFKINTLAFYGDAASSTFCFCTPLTNSTITLSQTVLSPQSYGPCNPFCDCLELASG